MLRTTARHRCDRQIHVQHVLVRVHDGVEGVIQRTALHVKANWTSMKYGVSAERQICEALPHTFPNNVQRATGEPRRHVDLLRGRVGPGQELLLPLLCELLASQKWRSDGVHTV